MQPIVVVLDLGSAEAARASFERIRQAIERMQGMPLVLPHNLPLPSRLAELAPTLASVARKAEFVSRIFGNAFFVIDDAPPPPKTLTQHQPTDLAAIMRELKALAAERAPRYPKHDVPNALLRQRRADMLRASTRPGAEWMAGHTRKVVRRVHRHRRRT